MKLLLFAVVLCLALTACDFKKRDTSTPGPVGQSFAAKQVA